MRFKVPTMLIPCFLNVLARFTEVKNCLLPHFNLSFCRAQLVAKPHVHLILFLLAENHFFLDKELSAFFGMDCVNLHRALTGKMLLIQSDVGARSIMSKTVFDKNVPNC